MYCSVERNACWEVWVSCIWKTLSSVANTVTSQHSATSELYDTSQTKRRSVSQTTKQTRPCDDMIPKEKLYITSYSHHTYLVSTGVSFRRKRQFRHKRLNIFLHFWKEDVTAGTKRTSKGKSEMIQISLNETNRPELVSLKWLFCRSSRKTTTKNWWTEERNKQELEPHGCVCQRWWL